MEAWVTANFEAQDLGDRFGCCREAVKLGLCWSRRGASRRVASKFMTRDFTTTLDRPLYHGERVSLSQVIKAKKHEQHEENICNVIVFKMQHPDGT